MNVRVLTNSKASLHSKQKTHKSGGLHFSHLCVVSCVIFYVCVSCYIKIKFLEELIVLKEEFAFA